MSKYCLNKILKKFKKFKKKRIRIFVFNQTVYKEQPFLKRNTVFAKPELGDRWCRPCVLCSLNCNVKRHQQMCELHVVGELQWNASLREN